MCAPSPAPSRRWERGEDRDAGIYAGEQVDDGDADPHRPAARLAVGQAGDAHHPAHALDDEVVAGAARHRARPGQSRDRRDDQPGVGCPQAVASRPNFSSPPTLKFSTTTSQPSASLRTSAAPSGVAKSIAAERLPRLARENKRRRDLALAVPRRAPMARVVACPGPLDLDHVGAEITEQLRAPGSRQHARQIEHAQPGQRRVQRRRFHGLRSASTARAALCPGAPVTPPPG